MVEVDHARPQLSLKQGNSMTLKTGDARSRIVADSLNVG